MLVAENGPDAKRTTNSGRKILTIAGLAKFSKWLEKRQSVKKIGAFV